MIKNDRLVAISIYDFKYSFSDLEFFFKKNLIRENLYYKTIIKEKAKTMQVKDQREVDGVNFFNIEDIKPGLKFGKYFPRVIDEVLKSSEHFVLVESSEDGEAKQFNLFTDLCYGTWTVHYTVYDKETGLGEFAKSSGYGKATLEYIYDCKL